MGEGSPLLNMNYLKWLILYRFKSVLEDIYLKPPDLQARVGVDR